MEQLLSEDIIALMDGWDEWDDDDNDYENHINSLTESQKTFLDVFSEWLNNRRRLFLTVTGGPGSGKTHTVVKTLDFYNINVIKMAPTARLANKIGGRTIHSTMNLPWGPGSELYKLERTLRKETENKEQRFDSNKVKTCFEKSDSLREELQCKEFPDVVVIDEVGMVPFWLLYRIVEHFFNKNNPILVIAMGDCRQLRPVTSEYNVFQVPFEQFEQINIDMKESKRFTPDYDKVIEHLRDLMDKGEDDEIFDYIQENFPVVDFIDSTILRQCKRALVYKKMTVANYNNFYLNELVEGPLIHLCKYFKNKLYRDEFVAVKANCMVTVTENNCGPVTNGTSLTFLDYDDNRDVAVCLDEEGKKIEVKRSGITGFIPLTVGFAGTIHKYQGETIDEYGIVFNFDQNRDLNLVYTALSRVRCKEQILAIAF